MTENPAASSIYSAGADSFAQGWKREDCPYPPDAGEREEWLRGWDEAAARGEREAPDAGTE
jgi:ribosome modulation factor